MWCQYPVVTRSNIKDGKKGQPDYTGGVHGESNELGFIEVLWALSGLEGIPRKIIIILIRFIFICIVLKLKEHNC